MDIQAAIKVLSQHPDFKVIQRLLPPERYYADDGAEKRLALYLDTETTGFNSEQDKVIELAMTLFEYGADGKIYRIVQTLDQYQDPGFPIPAEISRITGITDDMVKDQQINIAEVEAMLNQAVLVIAHNAKFDRPFTEKLTPAFEVACWACSIADIPWSEEALESSKLEYLAYRFGFFYDGHRADIDVFAGIHLLAQALPMTGRSALKVLLENARKSRFQIRAINAPFDKKDLLKERGYRWQDLPNGQKCWVGIIMEDQLEEEQTFLNEHIYPQGRAGFEVLKIGPRERFSNRM